MNNTEEFYRAQPTEKLKQLLRDHYEDPDAYPIDDILAILNVLQEREPPQTDVEAAHRRFVEEYMPRDTENDL